MAHGWRPGMLEKNVLRVCDGMNDQRRPIAEKANHQSNYLPRSSTQRGFGKTINCVLLDEPLRSASRHCTRLGDRHSSERYEAACATKL